MKSHAPPPGPARAFPQLPHHREPIHETNHSRRHADRFRTCRCRCTGRRVFAVDHQRRARGRGRGQLDPLHQAADHHQRRWAGRRRRRGGQRAGARLPALRAGRQLEPPLAGAAGRHARQPHERLSPGGLQRSRRLVRRHAGRLLDEAGRQRSLPPIHGAADGRLGRDVRRPPADSRVVRRHQPHLRAGWPRRVRHQRELHRHGAPRRRVRARARGPPARDHHPRRRRRQQAPLPAEHLARRRSVPSLRRAHRVLAVGALRERQRREDPRREPRRDADRRRRRTARRTMPASASPATRSSRSRKSRRTSWSAS